MLPGWQRYSSRKDHSSVKVRQEQVNFLPDRVAVIVWILCPEGENDETRIGPLPFQNCLPLSHMLVQEEIVLCKNPPGNRATDSL